MINNKLNPSQYTSHLVIYFIHDYFINLIVSEGNAVPPVKPWQVYPGYQVYNQYWVQ